MFGDFRRVAIAAVAMVSLAAGLFIIWMMVRPEYVAQIGTPTLAAVFGLFLLPAIVYAGWELERTGSSRA